MTTEQQRLDGRTMPVRKTNLYESLPRLPLEESTPGRDELRRRLERLCDEILPSLANAEGYPIFRDHCFRRCAYDTAVGKMWRQEVTPPFVENASLQKLERAYRVAAWMLREGKPAVEACNNESLRLRGGRE